MEKREITGLFFNELKEIMTNKSQQAYRAKQIFNWIYDKKAFNFNSMKNLPDSLIKELEHEFVFPEMKLISKELSADGTVKCLYSIFGNDTIETVVIPSERRTTACLSTQVGCKYNCSFCMSGKDGFMRNLTSGEIVMQLLQSEKETNVNRISNVVFMGIGEPLDNYSNLIRSIRVIMDKDGLGIGKRKITISTAGLVPGIKKLASEKLGVNLSVSLHSADDKKRSAFMPINKKYKLRELIFALKEYQATEGIPVTFEYLLMAGLNDTAEDAHTLAMYVKGVQSKVNLIIYNPIPGLSYKGPTPEAVEKFKNIIEQSGVVVTVREERGQDINAACGQLKAVKQ